MPEVINFKNSVLALAVGNGSGRTWSTAAGAASTVFAFVQSMSWSSGRDIATIMDRGVPNHHKEIRRNPIELELEVFWTGGFPGNPVTGASASVSHYNVELMAITDNATARTWYQFFGAAPTNTQFRSQDGNDADTFTLTMRALAMNGPTASGYILTALP